MVNKFMLGLVAFAIACTLLTSCSEKSPRIYNTPDVDSFIAENKDSEYVILLAYGGTASNSVSDPIINNEDGTVQISFTNKKVKGMGIGSLHSSFRSFSGADRQVSAVIEVSENINSVSYFYNGEWKKVWTKKK